MRATVLGEGGLRREDDLLPEGIGSVGAVVTIPGVVRVTRGVRVGAGVRLTVRGGRLESTLGGVPGGGFNSAFAVDRGGSLVLEGVRVVGAGVEACTGGSVLSATSATSRRTGSLPAARAAGWRSRAGA